MDTEYRKDDQIVAQVAAKAAVDLLAAEISAGRRARFSEKTFLKYMTAIDRAIWERTYERGAA